MPHIFEKTHYKNSQVYDTDDLILSHNSNVDFSMTVGQIQSMPVGTCATGASTAAKVVNLASDSFGLFTIKDKNDQTKALLGRTISVNFTNKNTATSMTLNVASTGAYPVTSHGVAVKAGAIGSGNYTFRFMPYGTSYSWDVLDNNGLIEVTNTEMTFWDGHKELTADQVNSALSDYVNIQYNANGQDYCGTNYHPWIKLTLDKTKFLYRVPLTIELVAGNYGITLVYENNGNSSYAYNAFYAIAEYYGASNANAGFSEVNFDSTNGVIYIKFVAGGARRVSLSQLSGKPNSVKTIEYVDTCPTGLTSISIDQNAVVSDFKNAIANIKDYWSLRGRTSVSTTETTETVGSGRKFSDYVNLLFTIGSSATNIRNTIILPSGMFTNGSTVYLYGHYGANNVEVDITRISDTQYKIQAIGTYYTAYVGIIGLMQ